MRARHLEEFARLPNLCCEGSLREKIASLSKSVRGMLNVRIVAIQ